MIGQTVSHFEILEKLGEGGMGVVYKARDTQLDRLVALKFLTPDLARQTDPATRFLQEARAASALNHPNIVTIHEIGEFEGARFIAMEFVRGKSLDDLIGKKGLRLSETLRYAIQIADALAKAHAAGIVHRDLKPANIMVSDEGTAKVLDFGLAKLTDPTDAPGQFAATVSMKHAPHTEDGALVGTVAYMSPEQAEGKKVDARSDIFSFGSVLYEMLTGRPPFRGDSKLSTLSAILRDTPQPLSGAAAEVPRDLEKITLHCLRKDPDRRFQHMDDLKVALLDVKEDSESGKSEAPLRPGRPSRRRWIVPVLLALLVLAGLFLWKRPASQPQSTRALTRLTYDSGFTTDPAISADGKLIAYASDRNGNDNLDIYVQQIPGGTPVRLTSDEADDSAPSFSPDGSRIVFHSAREGGGIYIVSVLGGEERLLAKDGEQPRFSPDGNWVAYHVGGTLRPCAIYVVAASGGKPRRVETNVQWAYLPVWSPDSKYLLFLGGQDAFEQSSLDWWVVPSSGGPAVATGALPLLRKQGLTARAVLLFASDWLPSGEILFSAQSRDSVNLWTLPIAPRTWKAGVSAQPVTAGSATEVYPRFSFAPVGISRLVFCSLSANTGIWSLPIDANRGKATGGLRKLSESAAENAYPTLSTNDEKLAFVSNRTGNAEIWLRDMRSGKETALTSGPLRKIRGLISPDGSQVAYGAIDNQKHTVSVVQVGGTRESQRICSDCGLPVSWTPDGKSIIYSKDNPVRWFLLDADTGKITGLLQHPKYDIHRTQLSPDGKWLAFNPKIGPRKDPICVAPYRPGSNPVESEWIEITDGSGYDARPLWSPSGNLLYFISQRDGFQCLWAQRLDPSTKRPVGPPASVQHFHSASRPLIDTPGVFVGRSQIVMALREFRGNIWMTELAP